MALIYITGAPGVGKTTLQQELERAGLQTYDIDDARFGGPHNKLTGGLVTIPPADERSDTWFDEHEWRVYRSAIADLKSKSINSKIVVCGVADKDVEVIDLFDKVIYLSVDEATLKQRLQDRDDNDYGKNDSELKEILERKDNLGNRYNSSNAVIVDASNSLHETVADIMKSISN